MLRLLILSLFATVAPWVQAAEFSVVVHGIPRPVTMDFPGGFRLADSPAAHERREGLLNFYRLNPAHKGHFDEILLRDWRSTDSSPCIVIGTLGSTDGHQGRITVKNWDEVRQKIATTSKEHAAEIRDQYRRSQDANSPVKMKTIEELSWFEEQTDPNSIVLFFHSRKEVDGQPQTSFSGQKYMFHNGFLVFANVVVDSSRSEALKTLKEYLSALSIKSI